MNRLRLSLLFSATVLAGCSGGGPESPDFQPEYFIEKLEIQHANGAPVTGVVQMPAGTAREFRVIASVARTVPPGTSGAEQSDGRWVVRGTEPVTTEAQWSSNHEPSASVAVGRVLAKAPRTGVNIGAAYRGVHADPIIVDVTSARLEAIRDVRPEGRTTAADDRYSTVMGLQLPFEMLGRFSDGTEAVVPHSAQRHQWTSSILAVAAKPNSQTNEPPSERRFQTVGIGDSTITGRMTQDNAGLPSPDAASATLAVVPANEFCQSVFSPGAIATVDLTGCTGCTASDDGSAVKDGRLDTGTKLGIPLALASRSVISVTVANPAGSAKIRAGNPAGFVIGRTAATPGSAELLSNVSVTTLAWNADGALVPTTDAATSNNNLVLTLLGQTVQGGVVGLVATGPTTLPYDGVRLTFNGGMVGLLTSLDVFEACPTAVTP